MTHRKSAFSRKGRESKLSLEILAKQFERAPSLPRRQAAAKFPRRIRGRGIAICYVRAKKQTEIVEKKVADQLRVLKARQNHSSQLVENRVNFSIFASQKFNSGQFGVLSERIQSCAGDVVVYPIYGTRIALSRIRFKVVNPDAARRPGAYS